jgi:hypothetical protein
MVLAWRWTCKRGSGIHAVVGPTDDVGDIQGDDRFDAMPASRADSAAPSR